MADFTTFAIDPATGLPKQAKPKQPALPYLDTNPGSQQNLPLVPQAPQAAQTQLLGQAGAKAQAPSPTAGIQQQTAQMTEKMMADPNFGWNQDKYKGTAMSAFDLDRANASRTFKEQYGDIGGSGQVQENLIQSLMQGNIDRSKLENQLDTEGVERAKKNWLDAISAGQTETKGAQDLENQRISNLLGVSQGYEGGLNREADINLADINQKYALALQSNDLASAKELQNQRIIAESSERALDRQIDMMRVEMQRQGMDFDQVQAQYEALQAAEEAGTAEAGSALRFLQGATKGMQGIQVLDPSSEQALQASLDADLRADRYKFMTTHPEYMVTDPKTGQKSLSAQGIAAYNTLVNQALYEEGGLDTAIGIQQKAAQALRDPAAYQQLLAIAKPWAGQSYEENTTWPTQNNQRFINAPAKDSVYTIDGKMFLVTSDVVLDEAGGNDSEFFVARDLQSGETRKIYATGYPSLGVK
jgi:hypothetical protein